MKFKEITNTADIDILLSIAKTYKNKSDDLEPTKKQLFCELGEAGDNRIIIIGFKKDVNVAVVQIILKNADNDPDFANGKDIAHVHNLQVRKDFQGKGIGQMMMAYVEDKARNMGIATLTLGVDDSNERAIDLYKKLGYEVFKVEPGRIPEEKCLAMRKSLGEEL